MSSMQDEQNGNINLQSTIQNKDQKQKDRKVDTNKIISNNIESSKRLLMINS